MWNNLFVLTYTVALLLNDNVYKHKIDQILLLNYAWLSSDETAVDIDRFMHYILYNNPLNFISDG
jgi:hypothetical protein